ncbi:hypothetical protein VTK56DRAFT_8930 [Thermocarpiscus australiensis]
MARIPQLRVTGTPMTGAVRLRRIGRTTTKPGRLWERLQQLNELADAQDPVKRARSDAESVLERMRRYRADPKAGTFTAEQRSQMIKEAQSRY